MTLLPLVGMNYGRAIALTPYYLFAIFMVLDGQKLSEIC